MDKYLDRELSDEAAREVELHLAACPDCRGHYGPLIEFLSAGQDVCVPEGLDERIITAVMKPARVIRARKWPMRFTAVAASIGLFLAGSFILSSLTRTRGMEPDNSRIVVSSWLMAGMVQSTAMHGMINPGAILAQAQGMEKLTQRFNESPEPIMFASQEPEKSEPPESGLEWLTVKMALLSHIQRL
ncbi:MAG: anti-sigma factor [Phycisphaerae bacterium]